MPVIMRNMAVISRCASQYRSQRLAPLGLKGNHAHYILLVCREPGLTQDQIAQRLYIDKSNVARQMAVLEEQGFIRRESCPGDKRVLQIYPTSRAKESLPQIRQTMQDWEQLVTQDLSDAEREQLADVLIKIRARATAWAEED